MRDPNWHQLAPEEVASAQGVEPAVGLLAPEVAARRARLGPNALPMAKAPSMVALLLAQFKNFIVALLLVAALISLALGEIADGLAILVALLLNAAVGFFMDYRAEQALSMLRAMAAPKARVKRDGQESEIPAQELVPGDVVLLEAGSRVPADGRLIFGTCTMDEALLTGESVPTSKHAEALAFEIVHLGDRANELFAGTLVAVGSCAMIVTGIGAQTEVGRIGRLLSDTSRETSILTQRLDVLGRYLVWSVSAVAGILVTLGIFQGRPFLPLLETAVVLAIAAIPEGLPAVATLALAAGARRLAKRGVHLRTLGVLESLGAVTTLCLDKTGTLTENAMTATEIRIDGHRLTLSGHGWTPVGHLSEGGTRVEPGAYPALNELLRAVQLCNDGTLERDETGWHVHGDPSEGALLVAAAKQGLSDPRTQFERTSTIPPGPQHPWMLTVYGLELEHRAFIKGAPEEVLARCSRQKCEGGLRALGAADREAWLEANRDMAAQAMRVFGVATAEATGAGAAESDWQWLGLIGMADPPRPGVREALAMAHQAGIRTLMITGDQPATAVAIARELVLAADKPLVVAVGSDALRPDVDVYARATPEGKLRLVQALQLQGEVAVMTGDGVNDAPALRAAIVGVAMGRGADVAREAAAIVLTDERLSTLLEGIREGRQVFLNIQKALDFLLTCSVTTMLTVFLAAATDFPLPLLPLQILYLNLLTHTFPALGLALEPAEPGLLKRPPLPRDSSLLPPARLGSIMWHAMLMAFATLLIGSWGIRHGGTDHGRTLVFATLATSLMLHTFADRSASPFGGWAWPQNPLLLAFLAIAVSLQLLAIYLPPLAHLLELTPILWNDWLSIILAAGLSAWAVEISKRAFPPTGRTT